MSAIILSKKHIDTLVQVIYLAHLRCLSDFYVIHKDRAINFDSIDEIGQILVNQNYASVNFRYDEKREPPQYKFELLDTFLNNPALLLKACNCYDYQSCETVNYKETIASAIIDGIKDIIITNLPGYDDEPWGIDD